MFSNISHDITKPISKENIDSFCEYLKNNHPSNLMKKLYEKFKSQEKLIEQNFVLSEMLREYNRNNIFLQNRIKCLDETRVWLDNNFSDFCKLNMEWNNVLLCGKPQAGKSSYMFGIALLSILKKKPCIFVVRNYIQDAAHMKIKFERFSQQHKIYMEKLGYNNFPSIKIIDSSVMTLCKKEDNNFIVKNYDTVKEALRGNNMEIVVALSNGTQLKCLNMVLDQLRNENREVPDLVTLVDEADCIGYSEIKINEPSKHKAKEYEILQNRSNQIFEISATVWDILVGNKKLSNTNIIVINPPKTYKGISDGVTFKSLQHKIEQWKSNVGIFEEDPNLRPIYTELMSITPFKKDKYNCSIDHPVIVLHKTRTLVNHHKLFFETFKNDIKFSETWTVVMECVKGLYLYSKALTSKTIKIKEECFTDHIKKGVYNFGKKIIIPQLLQYLINNGGAERFSHIVIKSGGFSGRSRSYVSTDGNWHLTHQYYNGSNSVPQMIQAQRILHDRPDSIPLIEYAPQKVINDLKNGDKIQDEQIDRLIKIHDRIYTHEQVEEEVWNISKVPKKKLYVGKLNIGFKIKKVYCDDGGWDITNYKHNFCNKEEKKYIVTNVSQLSSQNSNDKKIDKIIKNLSLTKKTKLSIFLSSLNPEEIYTKSILIELAGKACYKQPKSIFSSMINPNTKYGCGCIFTPLGENRWVISNSLKSAWKYD